MRNAYALLGLSFLIVFGGAYLLMTHEVEAPTSSSGSSNKEKETMTLTLTSPAFAHNGMIPAKYTCDEANILPPLQIEHVPGGAESLVLVMDDPDIPEEVKQSRGIEKFDHFVVYNLSPDTRVIPEGVILGSSGKNSRGEEGYVGPCPPREYEPTEHRYIFRLYALRGSLNFVATPTLGEVESAAQGMMIEQAELIGRYERPSE